MDVESRAEERAHAIERLAEVQLDGGAYADSFANLSAVCKAVYDPPFGWTLGAVATLRDRLVDLLGAAEGPIHGDIAELEGKLREFQEYAEDLSGACELLDGENEKLRQQVDSLTAELRDCNTERLCCKEERDSLMAKLREIVEDGCSS